MNLIDIICKISEYILVIWWSIIILLLIVICFKVIILLNKLHDIIDDIKYKYYILFKPFNMLLNLFKRK